jgi:hypothetical protein
VANSPGRHISAKSACHGKREARTERRWVSVAVAAMLIGFTVPRTAEHFDDNSVRFLSVEAGDVHGIGSTPRIEMSPLDVNRLPASAFGD